MTPGAVTATGVAGVVVAVPAHDEEREVAGCLDHVWHAVAALHASRPDVPVAVVVAADACTDATAEVARRHGALVVEIDGHCVGAARDAAITTGLERLGLPADVVWLASTDADSRVPPHWLGVQLELAAEGAELVAGTVEPDHRASARLLAAWHRLHDLREGHPHVHGANLGMSARAWGRLGGFGQRRSDEDVELVARARDAGLAVRATDRHRVRTSARLDNRVSGGFGGYLRALLSTTGH